LDHLQVR